MTLYGNPIDALVDAAQRHGPSSAVEFSDCVESIGVGLVSTTKAEALVPAPFIVVEAGPSVTPLVVRTRTAAASLWTADPRRPAP